MGWTIWGANPHRGKGFSPSPNHLYWLQNPLSLIFSGNKGSFLGLMWLGHEIDHSPPSSAEVTAIPLLLHCSFMAWIRTALPFLEVLHVIHTNYIEKERR
jgi:hypothetical protein